VTLLEDDGFECLFGNNKCTIKFDNKVVDLAPRQGMMYILSLNDFPMMNVCDVTNKQKRNNSSDNETSSKLWHCRLGHILRGRMECLIKEEILAPLDFSALDHCIDDEILTPTFSFLEREVSLNMLKMRSSSKTWSMAQRPLHTIQHPSRFHHACSKFPFTRRSTNNPGRQPHVTFPSYQ
jgi:hypothetical protein